MHAAMLRKGFSEETATREVHAFEIAVRVHWAAIEGTSLL
jgi:hypothetical protein